MLEKLKRFSTNEIIKHLFILLLVLIPLGVLYSVYDFYNTSFHSDLLKGYIFLHLLEDLIFFLPVVFITAICYTINTIFPDKELKKYNKGSIITFFIEFSFVFIFIIIFLIELLSTTLIYRTERYYSKDINVKLQNERKQVIIKLEKSANKFTQNREFYKALEKLQEVLIIFPDHYIAQDKIKRITKEIMTEKNDKLKKIMKRGVNAFEKKKYPTAIKEFNNYLNIEPYNREVLKYLNLSMQKTNKREKRIVKDEYNYKIVLNSNNEPIIRYKNKIISLISKGKKYYYTKKYDEAKKIFKTVLCTEIDNYDALYYLGKVNQKVNMVKYFTNRGDKLIKKDRDYIHHKYILKIKELRKANDNDYIFFNTTFIDKKTKKRVLKRYGYYDEKKNKYIFINDIINKSNPLIIDNIDPMIAWYHDDIVKRPERFSTFRILSFYTYFKKYLKQEDLFKRIVIIKINYYVMIIFLLMNFVSLFFYLRRRVSKKGLSITDLIFPAIIAILINKFFLSMFSLIKKIVLIGEKFYPLPLILNISAYFLIVCIFMLLIQLLKIKRVKEILK